MRLNMGTSPLQIIFKPPDGTVKSNVYGGIEIFVGNLIHNKFIPRYGHIYLNIIKNSFMFVPVRRFDPDTAF